MVDMAERHVMVKNHGLVWRRKMRRELRGKGGMSSI